MDHVIADRYSRTVTANCPGSTTEHGHQCTPLNAGDVVLGAFGYLDAGGTRRPIAIALTDNQTFGDQSVPAASYSWDDGQGGQGAAGTAYLTGIFGRPARVTS
jgi:hypothetical protein